MDQLARDFADEAHFLFIYTREAHPDSFPDHPTQRSLEQKYEHAHDMRAKFATPRTILIDGLDGEVHRAWSGLSNMSWIVDHTGRVSYKGAWTSSAHIRPALEYAIQSRELKREGSIAFYQETVAWSMPVRGSGFRRPEPVE